MALNGYKKRATSAVTEISPCDNKKANVVNIKNIAHQIKKRNWAFVAYPESVPQDFFEQLTKTGLQIAISPLHDKDIEPDGKAKKPHWHIILIYNGPTSFAVVKKLTDSFKSPIPIPLEGVRGYYRYFTHKDNPEKYQYDEKEIKCLNGFSILDFVEITKSEVMKISKELQILIQNKNILEYSDLMDFILEFGTDSEYDVASSHTYFFDKYISSRRNKNKNNIVSSSSASSLAQQASE